MRVLITGSTTWTDTGPLRRELASVPAGSTIITGDTPGIDAMAIALAQELGLAVQPMRKNRTDRKAHPVDS